MNADHVLYLVGAFIYGSLGITLGGLVVLICKMIKSKRGSKPKITDGVDCKQSKSLETELNDIANKTGKLREAYKLLGEYLPKIEGVNDEKEKTSIPKK